MLALIWSCVQGPATIICPISTRTPVTSTPLPHSFHYGGFFFFFYLSLLNNV